MDKARHETDELVVRGISRICRVGEEQKISDACAKLVGHPQRIVTAASSSAVTHVVVEECAGIGRIHDVSTSSCTEIERPFRQQGRRRSQIEYEALFIEPESHSSDRFERHVLFAVDRTELTRPLRKPDLLKVLHSDQKIAISHTDEELSFAFLVEPDRD